MVNWRRGKGQSAKGICTLHYIYMKLIWCNGFPDIYAQLERGPSAISIYGHSPICEMYLV